MTCWWTHCPVVHLYSAIPFSTAARWKPPITIINNAFINRNIIQILHDGISLQAHHKHGNCIKDWNFLNTYENK